MSSLGISQLLIVLAVGVLIGTTISEWLFNISDDMRDINEDIEMFLKEQKEDRDHRS